MGTLIFTSFYIGVYSNARGVHVVVAEAERVGLEDALLEEAGAHVEHDVEGVEQVGEVVEGEPVELGLLVDLVEAVAVDDDPEVVEEGERDDQA